MSAQVKIGLVQIGDKFGEQYYLPYSIGLLQAYAQRHVKCIEDFSFMQPVYRRLGVDETASALHGADIVFFSCYIWNYRISLKVAEEIKRKDRNCLIVFGGPQVPESPVTLERFLREYPFIDTACYGEGEIPFAAVLENYRGKTREKIPSTGSIARDNRYIHNPPGERIKDLNEIPSPYLEGVFEALIRANPHEKWSALLETNRGCPFTCTYCYWGKKTRSRIHQFGIERVFREIDWFGENRIEFVFCCDANFGFFDRDIEIAEKVAGNKKNYGYPMAFSVQNTKNSTEKIFLLQKILNDFGLQKGVNLALQSVNEETLKSIRRNNISGAAYRDLQIMFNHNRISTFSDIIIGLPDESYDTFTTGVSKLIENGQHNRIQFINLTVLENTEMSSSDYQNRYGFVMRESKVVPHHTSLENEPEVSETQRLVTGTNTMPEDDWVRTKVFCWMTSLLYFNKLLQIPLMLVNKLGLIPFRDLIGIFTKSDDRYEIISGISSFFARKAVDIQGGGSEYVASKEWLNIWWPADEYMFIKLCVQNELPAFYVEAESALNDFLKKHSPEFPEHLLCDAVRLNMGMIKLPFVQTDTEACLHYNVYEVYRDIFHGCDTPLERGRFYYTVDRTPERWDTLDTWLREMVWYGTKKGAYLYDCRPQRNNNRTGDRRNDAQLQKNTCSR